MKTPILNDVIVAPNKRGRKPKDKTQEKPKVDKAAKRKKKKKKLTAAQKKKAQQRKLDKQKKQQSTKTPAPGTTPIVPKEKGKRGRPKKIRPEEVFELPTTQQPTTEVSIEAGLDLNSQGLAAVPPFPIWGLPKVAREFCEQGAKIYSVPVDIFAASVIGAIGAALRKKAIWKGKHLNYPQMWSVIIAGSGTGKSEPLSLAFAPLEKIDREAFYAAQKEKEQAGKETEKTTGKSKIKQTLINDSTPEALYQALSDNKDGLTLYRDELVGFFDDFGRYNSSGEVGHLLSIYSNQAVKINRKTEDFLLIDKPFLGLIGTIQPEVLAERIKKMKLIDNGFAARLSYYYPEGLTRPEKYIDKTLPQPLIDEYERFILSLNDCAETEFNTDEEAMNVFKEFFTEMSKKTNRTDCPFLTTVYAKIDITLHRLALLISAALYISGEQDSPTITADTMKYSVEACRYFVATGEKVQMLLGNMNKHISNGTLINLLYERYDVKSDTALSKALNVSQQAISKARTH